jgi:hypothetical protein
MNPIFIIAALGVAYLIYKNGATVTGSVQKTSTSTISNTNVSVPVEEMSIEVTTGVIAPQPSPAKVAYELGAYGIHLPATTVPFDTLPGAGAVAIGGKVATTGYNPMGGLGTDEEAATAVKLASQVIGITATVGSLVIASAGGVAAATAAGGLAGAMAAAAPIVPFVGAAIAAVALVVACIEQHHAKALATEGTVLNQNDPLYIEAMLLVVQAVIVGEIKDTDDAQNYLGRIVTDWYASVKSIQKGTWNYTLTTEQDPSILAGVGINGPGDPTPGEQNWFDAGLKGDARPDPCNAACVVGHYFIERDARIALLTCDAILKGNHGIMTFPALPAHDTQSGVEEIQLLY